MPKNKTSDFVYDQVLKLALNQGASQTQSRNAAQMAMQKYKQGRYKGKVSAFILESAKQAKKL